MFAKVICLVSLLLTVARSKPSPQQVAEFEQLYALRMQQWLVNKTEDQQLCFKGLASLVGQCRTGPWGQMMQYSAHGFNDLGNQELCDQLTPTTGSNSTFGYDFTNATYVVMSLNVSTAPVFFRQGACLPKQCTEGMYIEFSERATSFLTGIF